MLTPILIIGDSKKYRYLFETFKDKGGEYGINVENVPSCDDALLALNLKPYGGVVIDWELPLERTIETVKQIRKMRPALPMVTLTGSPDAAGYLDDHNQIPGDYLTMTGDGQADLFRLIGYFRLVSPELQARILPGGDLISIQTKNEKMRKILSMVEIIKQENGSVLLQGENGTGKEFIARLLHYTGNRQKEPFVAMNCAAIPEALLESELFGHEKGSFTGAMDKKIGKFELGHKGTVFLDEIGDMPLNTQTKILRALDTREIERVGGYKKIPVDLRIISATNQNLVEKIERGEFRQDLYYRINTFTLVLPPLRERREDLASLAQHFLDLIGARRGGGPRKRLSRSAEEVMLEYHWPGNVRELRNVMERAAVLTEGSVIGPEVLPDEFRAKPGFHVVGSPVQPQPVHPAEPPPSRIVPLRDLERNAIIEVLSQLENNATEAAKKLGISKATLYRRLKQYGISRQLTISGQPM